MPYIGNTIRAADDYRLIDDISSGFNGSTTSFALQVAGSAPVPFPKSPQQVLISVNGVIQEPDPTGSSGFNLVGTNIVFSSAPTNGHAFFGIIYATADYLNAGGNFPAGSLGAPSITFIGDENTGLFRKSGGSVGFVSDATEIANFDSNGITISSGNLIIPDSIIHGGDSDTKIRFPAANTFSVETGGVERMRSGSENVFNETGVDMDFRVEGDTDANLLFGDASTDRIGIGTSTPSVKTQISVSDTTAYSASTISANQFQLSITNTGAAGVAGLLFVTEPSSGNGGHCGIRALSTGSGDSALTFSTRGSNTQAERMRIDSSGRVIIGANSVSPANTYSDNLVVSEASGDAGISIHGNNSNSNYSSLYLGDAGAASRAFLEAQLGANGNFTIGASGTGPIRFLNNSAERMRIDSAGRVLIGTTTPVLNESGFNEIVVAGKSEGAAIHLADDNNNVQAGMFTSDTGGGTFYIRTITNNPMAFRTNNTERMRIDSSGKVGIGTSSPQRLLHQHEASSAANYHQFTNTTTGAGSTNGLLVGINQDENGLLWHYGSQPMRFATGNTERMRIDESGNVGIGTTGPKAGLHVATENTTYGKNAVFGANGWVNNANYHYTDATISLLGQDADGNNKGAGIEFSTRNTADTNWRHGAINQERDSDLVFILGGSGTFQGVERLRIKGNGLMAFNSNGTVNATYQFDYAPATGGLIVNANAAFTGNSVALQFRTAPSTTSGNITLTNNGTTTAYGTSSDYRLKENAVAISDGITRLKTLKPYRFNFKTTPDTTVDGFFAHEVTAVPEAIVGDKDEVDSDNNPVYQSMDYAKITPLLTAALQEAITKIETLESEVAVLKAA